MKKYIFYVLFGIGVFSITYIRGNNKNIEAHKKLQAYIHDFELA